MNFSIRLQHLFFILCIIYISTLLIHAELPFTLDENLILQTPSTTIPTTFQSSPSFQPLQKPHENTAILYPASLTDGEDTLTLQGAVHLHNATTSFRRIDFMTFHSETRLPPIENIVLYGWCSYEGRGPVTICVNQTLTTVPSIDMPITFIYIGPTSDQAYLNKVREFYFIATIHFTDVVLLYPLTLPLSFKYHANEVISTVETTFVTRHYFESFKTLYWYTPCENITCEKTNGMTLMMEGWSPPPKEDSTIEALQDYGVKFILSRKARFIGFNREVKNFCSLNYYTIEVLMPTNEDDRSVIMVLQDFRKPANETGPNVLPIFEFDTLYFRCPFLQIEFDAELPKDYTLTIESGFLLKGEGWAKLDEQALIESLRWIPQSSYTDMWRYKSYSKPVELVFQPGSYALDGSTATRGYVNYTTPPTHRDRLIICGIEEASIVQFTVHQLVKNDDKQYVWHSYSPFGQAETQTSKSYPDPFDPAWSDFDYAFDEDINGSGSGSGSGDGKKKFIVNSIDDDTTTTSTIDDDTTTNNNNNKDGLKNHLIDVHNEPFGEDIDNEITITEPKFKKHLKAVKYKRFIDKQREYLQNNVLENLINEEDNDTTQANTNSTKPMFTPKQINHIKKYWSKTQQRNEPIQSNSQEPIHTAPPSISTLSQQNKQKLNTLSTPIEERVCVRLRPFEGVKKLTAGLYWFVGSFKLADQGDRFMPTSNDYNNQYIQQNQFESTSLQTTSTQLHEQQLNDPSTSSSFLDIFFQLLGSHTSAGVGLYNWKYQGSLSIAKDATIWYKNTPPTYTPPKPPQQSILSTLSSTFHSLTTFNLQKDPTPTPTPQKLEFDDAYPWNTRLPPIMVNITNKGFEWEANTLVLHSYGYHILSTKEALMRNINEKEKNQQFEQQNNNNDNNEFNVNNTPINEEPETYWLNPKLLSKPTDLDPTRCLIKSGRNNDGGDPNRFTEHILTRVYHVETLVFFQFAAEYPLQIDTMVNLTMIYIECPDLYLISEGYDMFSKKALFGLLFFRNPYQTLLHQQLQTQSQSPQFYNYLSNNNNGSEQLNITPFSTNNPLVLAPYYVLTYELSHIVNFNQSPRPSSTWAQTWFERHFGTRSRQLGLLVSVLAFVFIVLAVFTTVRYLYLRKKERTNDNYNGSYEEQEDQDLANLDIQRYNNQLKMANYNFGQPSGDTVNNNNNNNGSGSYHPPPQYLHSQGNNGNDVVAAGYSHGIDAAANFKDHYSSPTKDAQTPSTASTSITLDHHNQMMTPNVALSTITTSTYTTNQSSMTSNPTNNSSNIKTKRATIHHPQQPQQFQTQMTPNLNNNNSNNIRAPQRQTQGSKKVKNNYGDFM